MIGPGDVVLLRASRAELRAGRANPADWRYVVIRPHNQGLSLRVRPVQARTDIGDRIVHPSRLTLVSA